MVQPDLTAPGTEVEFTILGDRHRATVILDSPLDPSNARLRG
jgi:dimethylglycine dehydrogenase